MNVTGNTMFLNHFVDFYYLEALRANIMMAKNAHPDYQFRKAVTKLEEDVNEAFDSLSETMALRIYVYLWGAALGEAQYAHENCENMLEEVDERNWTYENAFDYYPTEHNVQMVKDVFAQNWRSGGYGGDAWLQIVEGMELYGKISNAAFIDHAVDLEHNGGCVFDKTGERPFKLDCFSSGFRASALKGFLDAKFSDDILKDGYFWKVSRKVFTLVNRFSNIIEPVAAAVRLVPALEWLTPFTVEWNDYGDNEFTWKEATGGMTCDNCGDHISEDESYTVGWSTYCEDCVTTCENCNETVKSDDTQYIDGENETWCDECANNNKVTCDVCGKDFHVDHTTTTEDSYNVCESCAETCEECGEYYFDMDYHMKNDHDHEEEEDAEEGESHPLPFDSDGVFEIVDDWAWMEPMTLVIDNISLHHQEPVKMFVRIVNGTGLKIINLGTYKQLQGEKAMSYEFDKYVIVPPCGLWFSKSHGECDLDTIYDLAVQTSKILDWNTIQTLDDWQKTSDDVQNAIRKLL